MLIERIQPPQIPESPLYSHVVKVGNLVFIAGQVAQNASGDVVGIGDFSAQAAQAFENLQRALQAAGGDLTSLVQVRIYLTDARFRDPFRAVNLKYLPNNQPASTLLIVAALARPEFLIEIDAVAAIG